MCGIAGIINFNRKPVNPSMLYSMSKAISHRGPDDEGYSLISSQNSRQIQLYGPSSNKSLSDNTEDIEHYRPDSGYDIGFAHRRFSIIDLSVAGHQPFISTDGRWSIVYNGELYNYKEIRAELESSGIVFTSNTDTEVFLSAYRKWGTKCFSKFNGFWAAAIFDPEKCAVLLCRDRIGVKPLYYMQYNDAFFFASEMKALLKIKGDQNITANKNATDAWLKYGIKDHTRETFFNDIKPFPQASWAYIQSSSQMSIQQYWSLPTIRKSASEYPLSNAINDLKTILTDAINVRLRADVPLAIQLSGGIDSSALACIAKHELGVELPAYTVRFDEPGANEEPYARLVADSCCKDYHVIDPPSESIWGDIDPFTWLHEEPYHSPNLFSDQHVLSSMRKNGIKVAINGAAGDENFGGYSHHFTLMQLHRLSRIDLHGYIKAALQCKDTPNKAIPTVKPILYAIRERVCFSKCRSLDINKRLLQDMQSTLMPYWLSSGDRSYMGLPIEIREPFLDYRIVEFAFTLPLDYMVRDGWQKWILRKTIEPYLPGEIVWRKRKMGYPFPLNKFLKQNSEIINHIKFYASKINDKPKPPMNIFNWKFLSYVLWHARFINRNKDLFNSIQNISTKNSWQFQPEYFNSWQNSFNK
jgi:asparagine synthase (glutamine-hydrolysing)